MEDFLGRLLRDLERRCTILLDRLVAIPTAPEARDHALGAYQVVQTVRRAATDLLADPSLRAPALLRNHLQLYKRWNEHVALVELYPLPFVERYAERDRRLTRLCHRLTAQVGWPLPPPLVAAFSSQYYWTAPEFNLICVPAAEGTTLLGLPDLCHELGHILLFHHESRLVGDFGQELASYVRREQHRVATRQRPPEYRALYERLFVQWCDQWLREFVADMLAVYLVGPAYAWQHVRLCAGRSQDAYHPALGEAGEHPADEARLRGVAAVLDRIGSAEAGVRVVTLWERYLQASGERQPADYEVCYPQALIDSLAERTIAGCRALGIRSFGQIPDPQEAQGVCSLMKEAWERFLADFPSYTEWERQRLGGLWQELGFGRPEAS